MKITKLTAENVKRLKAVRIAPHGNAVVIGGANSQGKSSVLDAIEMALGGLGHAPPEPVRRGEHKARIVVTLDSGLVVERTFEGEKSELVVRDADGTRQRSPQAILDTLVGDLAFDPAAFLRMKPQEQVAALKGLVGIDFSILDASRQSIYDERTEVGRELKRLQGARASLQTYAEAPAERVDVSALSAELQAKQAENKARSEMEQKLEALRARGKRIIEEIGRLQAELEQVRGEGTKLKEKVEAMPSHDVGAIIQQIADADTINRKVDANDRAAQLDSEIGKLADQSQEMSQRIEEIDARKKQALEDAKFTIDGLAFSEAGVTLNGLPLEQASQSQKIRVSCAIGMALNPKLRVLLVRDASLLDDDALRILAEMAAQNNAQVWLEVVGNREGCSVVISDGEASGADAEQAEAPNTVRGKRTPRSVAKEEPGL